MLLTGLLSMACSASFLIPPLVSWALPGPPTLTADQENDLQADGREAFSELTPFSRICVGLYHADKSHPTQELRITHALVI